MRGKTERTPEKVAKAREMRESGMSWKAIGQHFGVSLKTAFDWVKDPDGSQLRARHESYRGTCEVCGDATGGDNGLAGRRFCLEHGRAHSGRVAGQKARDRAEPRRRRIQEMWLAGRSLRDIAAELDTTVPSLASTFAAMRRDGWDLPYRYDVKRRASAYEARWSDRQVASGESEVGDDR